MNKLWTFGDSFTESYVPKKNVPNHWRHKYIELKGYETKVYPEFIAEKLNLNLVNKGKGGCDNSFMFEEFCKVVSNIKKNDIVIFGWTDVNRFRLFNKNNECGFFNAGSIEKGDEFFSHKPLDTFEFLSEKTIKEIIINRDSEMFIYELSNWIQLINFSLKDVNILHWSWDKQNSICKNMIISPNYETIKNETKGFIDDTHWSENGHRMFSEYMINQLNKKHRKDENIFIKKHNGLI